VLRGAQAPDDDCSPWRKCSPPDEGLILAPARVATGSDLSGAGFFQNPRSECRRISATRGGFRAPPPVFLPVF
jgi:hypothetical protein